MKKITNIKSGKFYKKARNANGLTQEYCAEMIKKGPRYISDLERNKTFGSVETLIDLCNLYKVTPTYILQDSLNIKEDIKIDSDLIGFYSLNNRDKGIVLDLIKSMNSRK